jgi:hypothetical protein
MERDGEIFGSKNGGKPAIFCAVRHESIAALVIKYKDRGKEGVLRWLIRGDIHRLIRSD